MDVQISSILGENITLVYDKLDLRLVDTTRLKSITNTQAAVVDTPDFIAAILPAQAVVIQFGDRRLRVTHQEQRDAPGTEPLWDIATKCHELVPEDSRLSAYGYNYDVLVSVSGADVPQFLTTTFLRNQETVQQALGGPLRSFTPRFIFQRDGLCDLILDPAGPQEITVHYNAHFQSTRLPDPAALSSSFIAAFDELSATLARLLKGDH